MDSEDDMLIEDIVKEIMKNVLISFPDYKKSFELYCDASQVGCGALLKQENKLMGIFSHKFTGPKVNYHTQEKEFLGILKAYEHFKNIIYCAKTIVYTDSKNLLTKH